MKKKIHIHIFKRRRERSNNNTICASTCYLNFYKTHGPHGNYYYTFVKNTHSDRTNNVCVCVCVCFWLRV